MKRIAGIIIIISSITGCTKKADSAVAVFEATINGSYWKATTASAVSNSTSAGSTGNFNITGYTEDGTAIYLKTKDNTVSNYNFRQQSVILVAFTASVSFASNRIDLNWKTSQELNADYFQVERSIDGINFEIITRVKAAGNSNSIAVYSYSNKPPFYKPFDGSTYYRLKMVDRDGSFQYSNQMEVRFGGPALYKFSDPNGDYAIGYSGSVSVTEVNTEKRLITGTFNFSYTNDNTGRQEKIENGTFRNIPY